MTDSELKSYLEFMTNPDNKRNCSKCPANEGFSDWQDRYPCGQWSCWVTLHCR